MKLIIDIPNGDELFEKYHIFIDIVKDLKAGTVESSEYDIIHKAVRDAAKSNKIINDDATNGDILKIMFPNEEIYKGEFGYDLGDICTIDFDWWNTQYQKGSAE